MSSAPEPRFDPERFDAVLFDLDGVLTDTARIHAAAWKQTFDAFLEQRAEREGTAFRDFDADSDYLRYVDGKPRYDGVRDVLHSRGIDLPEGEPSDPPERETVCGVGNRKDALVNEAIRTLGVTPYPGSVAWIEQLRGAGLRAAVVSSSANCAAVLRAAGIDGLFEVRVDGVVIAETGIAGKPAPDSFLEAARRMQVPPARAVVVEDAISGVEAGAAGDFGLVIGVSRKGDAEALLRAGADFVVADLDELVA